jgi:hypothetical protein
MADTSDARPGQRLPIKVILPNQGKERPVPGGGSPPKPFRPVTPDYRKSLSNQVSAIQQTLHTVASRTGSAPLRVKVIPKAVAKSHRPERLFSEKTCPIIGAGALGELFVKGTPDGVRNLRSMIDSDTADRVVKEISSVEVIEPVTPVVRRAGREAIDILRKSPRRRSGFLTRVKLFDYGADPDQERLRDDFIASCSALKTPVRRAGYAEKSFTYEVECQTAEQVESISRIIGVRSIAPMPVLRTVRPRVLNVQPIDGSLPSAKDVAGDFPVVAVVDTGVIDSNPALESWVIGRESYVAASTRNPTHGTFVAGLICWVRT